jgi:hypothetical protein
VHGPRTSVPILVWQARLGGQIDLELEGPQYAVNPHEAITMEIVRCTGGEPLATYEIDAQGNPASLVGL